MTITLPKLRCLGEAPEPPKKLVGGDLHRAQARVLPQRLKPRMSHDESQLVRKRTFERKSFKPRVVRLSYSWSDESVALMLKLVDKGITRREIAIRINETFPMEAKLTRNAVIGKLNRVRSTQRN